MSENPMKEIKIEKLTVNIGVGEVGKEVNKALNLLETLTNSYAVKTESSMNAKGFGLRENLEIGAKTTLRGEEAEEFLEKAFQALEENISVDNFDKQGNLSFGVEEYINFPGVEYNPDIGMQGFDVAVNIERPGYRVKKRDIKSKKVGKSHQVTPEESANFIADNFGVEVEGV